MRLGLAYAACLLAFPYSAATAPAMHGMGLTPTFAHRLQRTIFGAGGHPHGEARQRGHDPRPSRLPLPALPYPIRFHRTIPSLLPPLPHHKPPRRPPPSQTFPRQCRR